MKVYVATVGIGGDRFEVMTVGTYSTAEKAWNEARRVDATTAAVSEVEIDRTEDWATPESITEDRAAELKEVLPKPRVDYLPD